MKPQIITGVAQMQKDISANGTLVSTLKNLYIKRPLHLTNSPGFFYWMQVVSVIFDAKPITKAANM